MKKMVKKAFILITLIICLSMLARPLSAGAASKDTQEVTKLAKRLFNATKDYDVPKMAKCVKKLTPSAFNFYYWPYDGIKKVQRKINRENFSYKIKSVKVKGNTATIKAETTYYDSSEEYEDAYGEALSWNYYNRNASTEKFFKIVSIYYKENHTGNSDDEDNMKTVTVTLKATKVNGTWYITSTDKKFKKCVDGGSTVKMNYIRNHIQKYMREYYRP